MKRQEVEGMMEKQLHISVMRSEREREHQERKMKALMMEREEERKTSRAGKVRRVREGSRR